MKEKRMISIIMASIMILSAFPAAASAEEYLAIQNNPAGIQIPEGFSLQYIGRYHEASPVLNGMIAVSSGESRTSLDKPVWGFVNAETGKEVIRPQYTHDGYFELSDGFSDWVKYPRYFGNVVVLRDGLSATVINKQGDTIVPYGKYASISFLLMVTLRLEHLKVSGVLLMRKVKRCSRRGNTNHLTIYKYGPLRV